LLKGITKLEELISVIVPVYNVARYLNKCMKSIVNQTYKNLEIILINDGSTDNSGEICDEWKERDRRIKVMHKENTGVADTRNVGVERSVGRYITFVDSDDYIDEDFIENLYTYLVENNTDIVTSGHYKETFLDSKKLYSKNSYVENPEEILRSLLMRDDIYICVWATLFKRELFEEVKFPKGKICEDFAVIYKLYDKAERIGHISKCGYHYIQRQDSIMHQKYSKDKLIVIDIAEEVLEFVKEKYPRLVECAEKLLIKYFEECIILSQKNGLYEECEELRKKLRNIIKMVFKNKKLTLCTKIRCFGIAYLNFYKTPL